MELDQSLARGILRGEHGPTLRVYTWKPWAISLGRHQDPSEIDQEACRADGIDIVRRPTGGRAILHAEELTYCFVTTARGRSISQAYHEIGEALRAGLREFGVEALLERSQSDFSTLYRSASSIPCFSSTARYEVSWNGKKLIGSAQRRYGSGEHAVILQHGSILCGPAHRNLAGYLVLKDEGMRERIRGDLASRTTDLSEVTGGRIDTGRLAAALRVGFDQVLGVEENRLSFTAPGINDGEK
ncbi:MAG: lipoate--protein ligase family protein [Ignavibacteria bacterium]|nr:lipoate--protein ligase family protein [Ignavibacteria bacterium]